jgi:hypothetical protein
MTVEEAIKFLEDLQTFAKPDWGLYDNSDVSGLAGEAAKLFRDVIGDTKAALEEFPIDQLDAGLIEEDEEALDDWFARVHAALNHKIAEEKKL